MNSITVCALYKFVHLDNFTTLRQPLLKVMQAQQVKGTLLLALEGINGTISGSKKGVENILQWLNNDPRLGEIPHKFSYHNNNPFHRSKVKLKKEIVTMGITDIDPRHSVGTYVPPKDWNALISDPEVLLIDTRNDYEVEIGTFQNAIIPDIKTFRELPAFVNKHLDKNKHKKVAMFCTGGIRCEKSTAYLKQQGFENVYHLEGGILKYFEDVPAEESLWQGECFVFDDRVAVNVHLEQGQYDQCFACRFPITEEAKAHPHYIKGVSCPRCHDKTTPQQRQRFIERQRQIQLAKTRGEMHIGGDVEATAKQRRQQKINFRKEITQ